MLVFLLPFLFASEDGHFPTFWLLQYSELVRSGTRGWGKAGSVGTVLNGMFHSTLVWS